MTIEQNGAGQARTSNGWTVFNNAWGVGTAKYVEGKDFTMSSSFPGWSNMTDGTVFNWSFPDKLPLAWAQVLAYPMIGFGPAASYTGQNPTDKGVVLPVKVEDITHMTSNFNVTMGGNKGGYDVSYDIWFTDAPNAVGNEHTTNEVMIWTHKGDLPSYGTLVGTYSDANFSGKIYHTGTYTAIISDTDMSVGTIDIAAMVQKLQSLGIVKGSEYLSTIDFGAEVIKGTGSLTINKFDFDVTTKDANGVSTEKYVTGAGVQYEEITGGAKGDVIKALDINTIVNGGAGNDKITLGAGNDRVVLGLNGGNDVVTGFTVSKDVAEVHYNGTNFTPVVTDTVVDGVKGALIKTGDSSVFLQNVTAAALTSTNFVKVNEAAATTVQITSQKLLNDTGASATDNITYDGHVLLTGTVSNNANTQVKIYDGTTVLGAATLDGKGGWTFATDLAQGKHALTAIVSDATGSATTAAQAAISVEKTVTLSGVNEVGHTNGWAILNNAWGSSDFQIGKDYTLSSKYNIADPTAGTLFSWSYAAKTPYPWMKIMGYPELQFGTSPFGWNPASSDMGHTFPVKVSEITSLKSDYSVTYGGDKGGFDVSYDIWFSNKPNGDYSNVTNEVMVWLHKGDIPAWGDLVGTYSDANFSGKIYHTGTYTAIIPDVDYTNGTIDVAGIIAKLQTLGIISGSEYLQSFEFGAEPVQGTGYLQVNKLDIDVTSKDANGVTVEKLVTGAGTVLETITGSAKGDTIVAQGINSTINGGAGDDKITTGAGNDKVVISINAGHDEVTDFSIASDVLEMHYNTGSAPVIVDKVVNGVSGVLVTAGNSSVFLDNVKASSLNSTNFKTVNDGPGVVVTPATTVQITTQKLAHDTGSNATDGITKDGTVSLSGKVSTNAGTSVKIYDGATALGTATLDGKGGWTFHTVLAAGAHNLKAVASDTTGSASSTIQSKITVDDSTFSMGINLRGGATGVADALHFSDNNSIDYYAAKGFTNIRLPIDWEDIQPVQGGALDTAYVARIKDFVEHAAEKGMTVALDIHNSGYGYGNLIGSAGTPISSFADLWGKLAAQFVNVDNVQFGLMNEPHDQTAVQWLPAINAAIDAIRDTGADQKILVSGTYWDGADRWVSSDNDTVIGGPGKVVDPLNNFIYEVHQYLDNGSGQNDWVVSETIGVERLTAITNWARETGAKLYLGEFGVADNQMSLTALDNMLKFVADNSDVWVGGSYWAGGPAWSWQDYMYSVEPVFGAYDQGQMAILQKYTGAGITTTVLANGSKQVDTSVDGHVTIRDIVSKDGVLTARTFFNEDGSTAKTATFDGTNYTVTNFTENSLAKTIEVYNASEAIIACTTVDASGNKTVDHMKDAYNVAAQEKYDASGKLVTASVNENGQHIITNYKNGVATIGWVFKDGVNSGWILIKTTNYDANGKVASITTVLDNGNNQVDIYDVAGKVTKTQLFTSDWKFISETLPAVKTAVEVTTQTLVKDTGKSATDKITNDGHVTLSGTVTGNSGTVVKIYDGTTVIGTATLDGKGGWTLSADLAQGTHALKAVVTDSTGATVSTVTQASITVDKTAPVVGIASNVTASGITAIKGTAEAGASVKVTDGATVLGTVTADAKGQWALDAKLAVGTHNLLAAATDAAGNTANSTVSTLKIFDTTAVSIAAQALVNDTGISATDKITNQGVVNLSGKVTTNENTIVKIYDGATVLGNATLDGKGGWTYDADLDAGKHTLKAVTTDASGATVTAVSQTAITVDKIAPQVEIASFDHGVVKGTAEAGASVKISDGNLLLGTVTADAKGQWSLNAILPNGAHDIKAAATDIAGNTGQSGDLVVATGLDKMVLNVSEDFYLSNAQFTISVDGVKQGGTYTATALRAQGQTQDITLYGNFAPGAHTVSVNFVNDAYAGPGNDKNLVVNTISINGHTDSFYNVQARNGSVDYVVKAPELDKLVLNISEDSYLGDAKFTVKVDGVQVGGTFTATDLHKSGDSQDFTLYGNFGATKGHVVSVQMINDLYAAGIGDRNLYVNSITFNGEKTAFNAPQWTGANVDYHITPQLPDTLVLKVSEDAYLGDAKFVVKVDNVQVGDVYTATALHKLGETQDFVIKGDFGAGNHTVSVNFLNDAYLAGVGDRNLFVNSVTLNDATTVVNKYQGSTGYIDYNVTNFSVDGKLDLHSVLDQSHQDITTQNINSFLKATQVGDNTVISVDKDGAANGIKFSDAVTLNGHDHVDLSAMLAKGNLIA